MNAISSMRIATGLALASFLLAACGDVTVNGGYPDMAFTGNWWWSDSTDFIAKKTAAITEPVDGRLRLRLEAFNGQVAIMGQPDTGSVILTAALMVGSHSLEDAQENLPNLNILLEKGGDEFLVQTDQPELFDGRQYDVYYSIIVPSDLEVLVTQTNGDVLIENMENTLNIHAMNGRVDLLDVRGDVVVSLTSGDINGTVTLPSGGEVLLSTVNGNVDLRVPRWTSALLEATSGNGNVRWHNLTLFDPVVTTRSLTGTLDGGDGLIDLETVNGGISVTGF